MTLQPNTTMPIGPRVRTLVILITQTSTAAPTSTILQDTIGIGNGIWTRNGAGDYQINTTTKFDLSKTFVNGVMLDDSGGTSYILCGTSSGSSSAIRYQLYFEADPGTGNMTIFLYTKDDTGTPIDISSEGSNYLCLPQISIYQ